MQSFPKLLECVIQYVYSGVVDKTGLQQRLFTFFLSLLQERGLIEDTLCCLALATLITTILSWRKKRDI